MRALQVKDVMTRDVVSVRPDTPFKEAVGLMVERGISGLPVLEGSDLKLAGIVTESDLLSVEGSEHRPRGGWLGLFGRRAKPKPEDVRVRDLMTATVVTVDPQMPVREAARRMLEAGVKRLPVVEGGRLVGVVARGDLLRPFVRPDPEIAHVVVEEVIRGALWLDDTKIGVEVRNGVVKLAGVVPRRSHKELLVKLLHAVDGVVGVEADDLAYEVDDKRVHDPAMPTSGVKTSSLPKDFAPGGLRSR